MLSLTQVTPEEIERLDPGQLVDLLRILLHSEARLNCLDKTGIHVPHQITVADGGNDGEWNATIAPGDYIFRNFTVYQCKACEISASECARELFETQKINQPRKLKSQVEKAINVGGAYVFFCRKGYVQDSIDDRIKSANQALEDESVSLHDGFQIHFVDGNKISDWVNKHASAFAFVCRCLTRSASVAVADFKYWSGDLDFKKYAFQSNLKLDEFITEIRSALCEERSVVRVTGPSGLGKSRLAFEVLNAVSDGDGEKIRVELANSAIYLDMQVSGNRVLEWITQLNQWGISGVIIVDNCSRNDHNILEKAAMNSYSKISLLTLDYVPKTPFGTAILHLSLTPEIMRDVVPKILGSIPGLCERITQSGINRISDFAQGFPQIAVLTAEAGQALNLTELNQMGRIADKLLWGYDPPDPQAKEFLRCLAAFTEVGREGRYKSQIEFVRIHLCGGVSEYDFRRCLKRFYANRVLQDVGDFVMVSPTPLAVALAADWLEDLTEEDLIRLLPEIKKCDMLDCFSRRLGELDFSDRAQELSAKLMGPGGPFSSAEVLNSEAGSRVFRSLSDLNPLAAIDCLTRVFGSYTPIEAAQVHEGRRNLVWALERLCWDAHNFKRAARILLIFASGENETWANNATSQFCQLFHLALSGTQCPATRRLVVIEEGLRELHSEVQKICIEALGHGLRRGQFMRSSASGDTHPAELDWKPNSYQDMWDYQQRVFRMLHHVILNSSDTDLHDLAVESLGNELGDILWGPLVKELFDEFRQLADHLGNCWPTARDSIKRTLSYEKGLNAHGKNAIASWLACVAPQNLRSRLEDKICKPGWDHEEQPDGTYKDLAEEGAIQLARELTSMGNQWLDDLDVLLVNDQQQTFIFGKTASELSSDPVALFQHCLASYRGIPSEHRNPQLLRGMIRSLAERGLSTPILDQVADDSELRQDLLVTLTCSALPTLGDFKRVSNLVIVGELPPRSIDWFALGGVTCDFETSEFSPVLLELLNRVPDTAPWILHIAHMSIYRKPERIGGFYELFKRLVIKKEVIENLRNSGVGHAWQVIVDILLRDPPDELIRGLAALVIEDAEQHVYFSLRDSPIAMLSAKLLEHHSMVAWPVFAEHLRDANEEINFSLVELVCRRGIMDESGTPLWSQEESAFRKWAALNPDILPHLVGKMPLYIVVKRPESDRAASAEAPSADLDEWGGDEEPVAKLSSDEFYIWHPLASCVLDLCGHEDLVTTLSCRLFSFGSTGSRVPYVQTRLNLVHDLEQVDHPGLRAVARALIPMLENEIAREEKIDAQRAAGIHAR